MNQIIKPLMQGFIIFGAILSANGQMTNSLFLNFDNVNATAGPVNAAPYLATYGILLTNVNPPGTVLIYNDTNYYGGGAIFASSPHNFLLQNVAGSPNGISFTMVFNAPLQSFTFTRPATGGDASTAEWRITAYSGTNAVSSTNVSGLNSDFRKPAWTYTLNGPDITSVSVAANGFKFSAISSVPLDDFHLVFTNQRKNSNDHTKN